MIIVETKLPFQTLLTQQGLISASNISKDIRQLRSLINFLIEEIYSKINKELKLDYKPIVRQIWKNNITNDHNLYFGGFLNRIDEEDPYFVTKSLISYVDNYYSDLLKAQNIIDEIQKLSPKKPHDVKISCNFSTEKLHINVGSDVLVNFINKIRRLACSEFKSFEINFPGKNTLNIDFSEISVDPEIVVDESVEIHLQGRIKSIDDISKTAKAGDLLDKRGLSEIEISWKNLDHRRDELAMHYFKCDLVTFIGNYEIRKIAGETEIRKLVLSDFKLFEAGLDFYD